jgi:hypothetical protein
MQRTGKKNETALLLFLGIIIIVTIILLVQADHAGWLFFLVPTWLMLGAISFGFWFPDVISQPFNQIGINFRLFPFWNFPGILSPLYMLQSGKLQRDYFLLKNKPRIGLLYIYPDSAAVIQAKDGQKYVLQSGFHHLGCHKEILLCFKTGINQFVIGPLAEENPFDQKRSSESYTAYHSRRLRAQKVKTYTKDSREIFASLRAVYLLSSSWKQGKESENGLLQRIAADLQQKKQEGEAAQILEEYFGRRITDLWIAKISQLKSEEIHQDGVVDRIIAEINTAMRNPAQPSARQAAHQEGIAVGNYEPNDDWPIPFFRVYLDMLWLQPNQGSSPEKKS